jgi:hypothetical protein
MYLPSLGHCLPLNNLGLYFSKISFKTEKGQKRREPYFSVLHRNTLEMYFFCRPDLDVIIALANSQGVP